MGGKDAIIIDADADLDVAIEGVAQAAFGFQGQKCSACSRAIVDERVYDKFLEGLRRASRRSKSGIRRTNANMGAVINEASMKTILGYIEQGKKDGRLITGGGRVPEAGRRLFPSTDRYRRHFAQIEARAGRNFRPRAGGDQIKGFEHAMQIANDTEFGLTGAVYTKSRERIEFAIREFHVGNLYINRKCTGAMVGAHPFGGFNMSGTDSKVRRSGLSVFVHPGEVDWRENYIACGAGAFAREVWMRTRVSAPSISFSQY